MVRSLHTEDWQIGMETAHTIAGTKKPIPALPGQPARYDCEYRRYGMCSVFLACEPGGSQPIKPTRCYPTSKRCRGRPAGSAPFVAGTGSN